MRLNVGGKVFHSSWHLLLQVPESRLGLSLNKQSLYQVEAIKQISGRIAQCRSDSEVNSYCDHYNPANNELFFNQRYRNFIDILDFYRSGTCYISVFSSQVWMSSSRDFRIISASLGHSLLLSMTDISCCSKLSCHLVSKNASLLRIICIFGFYIFYFP